MPSPTGLFDLLPSSAVSFSLFCLKSIILVIVIPSTAGNWPSFGLFRTAGNNLVLSVWYSSGAIMFDNRNLLVDQE